MTVNFVPVLGQQPIAASVVTLYTALADQCVVPSIVVLNTSGSGDTYTVHRVPQGSTPSVLTKILLDQPIAGKERQSWTEKWFLKLGDMIQVVSVGGNVLFHMTAIENSTDA